MGFLIGHTLKHIVKILAVVVGLFLGALMYLQSQTIINVNWDKLQSLLESSLSAIGNSITNSGQISTVVGNLGIPLTGGLLAGFAIGFMKG